MIISPLNISPLSPKRSGILSITEYSFSFNGTNYLNLDALVDDLKLNSTGGFSFWFKMDDTTPLAVSMPLAFSDTDSQSTIRALILTTGELRFECIHLGVVNWRLQTTLPPFVDNVWYKVGLYHNGTEAEIFINGVKVSQSFSISLIKTKWFDGIVQIDNGRFGCQSYNNSGNANFITDSNVKDILVFSGGIITAVEDKGIYNYGTPKDESLNIDAILISYYKTGGGVNDNFNDTTANEWTFADIISNNDIFSGNGSLSDVVNVVPENKILTDASFANSIVYSNETDYIKRSTNSEYEFTYSGTYLRIEAIASGTDRSLAIFIDGVYDQTLTMVTGVAQEITLSSGLKNIKLVTGMVRTSGLLGVFLQSVVVDNDVFTKILPTNVSERFVFFGDSITQGSIATNAFIEGYAQLFKFTDSKNVTIIGYGGARINLLASDAGQIATSISWISKAFSGTTTTKKLIISLGINDWLNSETALNVGIYAGNLMDAINLLDSSIEIFWISPLTADGDDSALDDIRTAISDACSTRAYATHIAGKTILTYPTDYADTVHPNTSGHLKIHDAIDGVIL